MGKSKLLESIRTEIRRRNYSYNTEEGFDKPGDLVVFNAGVNIKPQHSLSIRGFYVCDKEEDGQKNSFAKPSTPEVCTVHKHCQT